MINVNLNIKAEESLRVKIVQLAGDDANKIANKLKSNFKLLEEQKDYERRLRKSFKQSTHK